MKTVKLLETIGHLDGSKFARTDREESHTLYQLARENKIGSLYLKTLADTGNITQLGDEWDEREAFHKNLEQTYRRLADDIPDGIEYAAVKSVYPFYADFKDIDILVFDDSLARVKESLLEQGFSLMSETPVSFDVVDEETNIQVDIQTNLAVRRVIYLDKATIKDSITHSPIAQSPIQVVSPAADLAVIIAHSIVEQLFILKEFYYALSALEEMTDTDVETFKSIIEANNLEPACRAFFTITRRLAVEASGEYPNQLDTILQAYGSSDAEIESLKSSEYQFPHRYSRKTGIQTITSKFKNATFARSMVSELPHLLYPPTFFYLLGEARTRFTRSHYAHEKRYE